MQKFDRLIIGVLVIWLATPIAAYFIFDNWTERGQFGDVFGSANALFSGFAFVGLIYTIWLQRNELEMQRDELKLQREEMIASRAELANQTAAQMALFHATAAQITVASAQAEIEALKMEINTNYAYINQDTITKVRAVATALSSLSDRVENKVSNS